MLRIPFLSYVRNMRTLADEVASPSTAPQAYFALQGTPLNAYFPAAGPRFRQRAEKEMVLQIFVRSQHRCSEAPTQLYDTSVLSKEREAHAGPEWITMDWRVRAVTQRPLATAARARQGAKYSSKLRANMGPFGTDGDPLLRKAAFS
eukprot:3515274-Pyramimonas_sp.AAC.1